MARRPTAQRTASSALDYCHAAGFELVLDARGNLVVLASDRSLDHPAAFGELAMTPYGLTMTAAIGIFAEELRHILAPWRCEWCGLRSDLPGLCTLCHRARAAHGFARHRSGMTHALRCRTRTVCGIPIDPECPAVAHDDVESQQLCQRCLVSMLPHTTNPARSAPQARLETYDPR